VIPVTLHVAVPTSAKATEPMPTIGPPSSASFRAIQVSSVFGWATTRTDGRATASSMKTFQLTARGCTLTNGRATGVVIQLMPPSAMVYTNGRAMMTVMASAKSIVIPVKERVRRSARTSVPFGASTSNTYISMWQRMKP